MPATTYLSDNEYSMFKQVPDKDLNELFQEIRIKCPEFLLEEHKEIINKLFKKSICKTTYTLYADLGYGEVQVMNFSSGTRNNKALIEAFFYGILAGRKRTIRNKEIT